MKRRPPAPPRPIQADSRVELGLIATVALVGAFVVVALAVILPGGDIGGDVRNRLRIGFGLGTYVAPVVLGALAAIAVRSRLDRSFTNGKVQAAGWLLELVAVTTLLQVVDGVPNSQMEVTPGGGTVGTFVWSTLTRAFGPNSALVLVIGLGLVALGLIFEVTPGDVWTAAGRFGAALARATGHLVEASRGWLRRRAERRPVTIRRPVLLDPDPETEADVESLRRLPAPIATGSAYASLVSPATANWQLPPLSLLRSGTTGELSHTELNRKIKLIEDTLADFDVYAKVVHVSPGPTITQFGLEPGFRERRDRTGQLIRREKIKVSEITSLNNDLALALAAPSIRIEAPVPGRQVVGLEIPNSQTTLVTLRQVVEGSAFQKLRLKTKLAIALGEDVSGQPVVADLARMPHLLIAGATGSGKSICINAIISCIVLQATPAEVRLILVDPKRVELSTYNETPHLLRPVVVDVDKVVGVLKWAVHEMDERYKLFEKQGVRNVEGFNKLVRDRGGIVDLEANGDPPGGLQPLPFIVVIIDELADLMMLAPDETERLICRLAQLARATGIHLIVATQRPSVDVITGLIKANFPTRISFAVTSQVDSRTILDMPGAEKLLGRGDMLYMPTDAAKPIRLQGVFVSDEEIEALVGHWRSQGPTNYVEALVQGPGPEGDDDRDVDELYDKAAEVAREHTRISASLLQRRLRIGYTRAARLMDLLEENSVVGPSEGGGRSREVHHEAAP